MNFAKKSDKIEVLISLLISCFVLLLFQGNNVDLLYKINRLNFNNQCMFNDASLATFLPIQIVINSVFFILVFLLKKKIYIITFFLSLFLIVWLYTFVPVSFLEYKNITIYCLIYLPSLLINTILFTILEVKRIILRRII